MQIMNFLKLTYRSDGHEEGIDGVDLRCGLTWGVGWPEVWVEKSRGAGRG